MGAKMKQYRGLIALNQLLLILYFHLLMEWLFFATKPSFLSLLSLLEQVRILFGASLPFILYGLAVLTPLLVIEPATRRKAPKFRSLSLLAIGPGIFATAMAIMQIDNFTYIVFDFGIARATGSQAYLYLAGVVALFLFLIYIFSREIVAGLARRRLLQRSTMTIVLVSISIASTILRAVTPMHYHAMRHGLGAEKRQLPNILFIAADGVDADHLSAYGYHRRTTPYMDEFLDDALIVENAITNCGHTPGSLTSMLTGKLPTTTKVISSPHALAGQDAYQHLPGILKGLGYETLQETIHTYGDGPDLNMKQAFDVANGKILRRPSLLNLPGGISRRFAWEILFHDKLLERISGRILHLAGIKRMDDGVRMVKSSGANAGDQIRIARSLDFMKKRAGPFFVHIHLMDTHCCYFRPTRRLFSAGSSKPAIETTEDYFDTENHDNYYDDAILSTDWHLGQVLGWLERSGKIENTLIVYSSDHSEGWRITRRVPLIFRFPQGEYAGRLQKTAQLLDVAPTVLDYLDVEIPQWMEGESLLRPEELSALRPIFSASDLTEISPQDQNWRENAEWDPPLYGLEAMALVLCHRWYKLNRRTGEKIKGEITNHSAPCPDSTFPSLAGIAGLLAGHLEERGLVATAPDP